MTRLPLARTLLEAEVYLGRLPCERCGRIGTGWAYAGPGEYDGAPADRYAGRCTHCGTQRSALLGRVGGPDAQPGPVGGRFGAGPPSELLDAWQWLEFGDGAAAAAERPGLADRDRLMLLEYAGDAYWEAGRFIPQGADAVPDTALFWPASRTAAAGYPLRLSRAAIDDQLDAVVVAAEEVRRALARGPVPAPAHVPVPAGPTRGEPAGPAGSEPTVAIDIDEPDGWDRAVSARTALRDELVAVAVAIYPDGEAPVTREGNPVRVGGEGPDDPERDVVNVGASGPASQQAPMRWEAPAELSRTAQVLAGRGWRTDEPHEWSGFWSLTAQRGDEQLLATMQGAEGILRLTAETSA